MSRNQSNATAEKIFDGELTPVESDRQKELLIRKIQPPARVDSWSKYRSKKAAYIDTFKDSDFQHFRDMAKRLGMNQSQFTRMMDPEDPTNLPDDKEIDFYKICGSARPLFYMLWELGFDPSTIRLRQSESERRIAELEEQLADSERKREYAESILTGRVK